MHKWEQQPQENQKAYQRFCQYRDMGPKRSLRLIAQKYDLCLSSVGEMSSKYSWAERVKEFDIFVDRTSQHNSVTQVYKMKRRHITVALQAQRLATKALSILLKNIKDEKQLSKLRPDTLIKILEFGCKLERINRDEPDQKIEFSQQYDYEQLSLEECEQLHNLIKKTTKNP